MSEPKFKYGDKVRVTTGFYRGVIGVVTSCEKPFKLFGKSEWKYGIEGVAPGFPCKVLLKSESGLELVEAKT